MKNVTITLEEEVARWARVWAARHDTSVSQFLGEILRRRMEEEIGYERAMDDFLAREPVVLHDGEELPSREELHDRPGLR